MLSFKVNSILGVIEVTITLLVMLKCVTLNTSSCTKFIGEFTYNI